MCGILALVSSRRPIERAALERGLKRLAHRGPDGQGSWWSPRGRAALGHTRLSIIDLEGGQQPIVSESGDLVLSANGEFYEHDRLLRALEARGHRLATRSDSEVALHLYEEMGPDALRLLRGEFAFVIWDEREQSLFAARDRFGIKPLFYAERGGGLMVASEVKALLAAGHPARWDRAGMFQSLNFTMHQDRTLFEGIRQVPPGHTLTWRDGRVTLTRYWDADFPLQGAPRPEVTDEELIHEVGRGLEEAIRLRLRSDVPVGCYLSGGVDSSSVLGLANLGLGHRLGAFTIAFEHPDFDEDPIASAMARRAGSDYHPIRVTQADFAEVFMDAVESCEGIQYNGHAPARYILSREVKRADYKVVLGGEGADELFLGYHFAQQALAYSTRPPDRLAALRAGARLLRPPTASQRFVADVSPLMALASRLIGFPDDLLEGLVGRFKQLRRMIAPSFLHAFKGRDPYREFLGRFDWRGQVLGREPVRQVIYLWLKSVFPNYVLGAERMDMAHAVELRLPFLDHHLFTQVTRIPARRLFRDGQNKHLLRRTVRPYVTQDVYDGAKQPFFAPPSTLFEGNPLTGLILDLLHSEDFTALPFFDAAEVRRWLATLPSLPAEERAAMDPVLYMLASTTVLARRYRLT